MDLRIKLTFCCFISPADVGDQNNASGDSQVCIYTVVVNAHRYREKRNSATGKHLSDENNNLLCISK